MVVRADGTVLAGEDVASCTVVDSSQDGCERTVLSECQSAGVDIERLIILNFRPNGAGWLQLTATDGTLTVQCSYELRLTEA